jgi:hypothetical protein
MIARSLDNLFIGFCSVILFYLQSIEIILENCVKFHIMACKKCSILGLFKLFGKDLKAKP